MKGLVMLLEVTRFITQKGVRQGSVLSPLLFIIVTDEIAKIVNGKGANGIVVGYRRMCPVTVKKLMYADDLILCAPTEAALRENMEMWEEELEKYNMHINVKKTEIMVIGADKKETDIEVNIGNIIPFSSQH